MDHPALLYIEFLERFRSTSKTQPNPEISGESETSMTAETTTPETIVVKFEVPLAEAKSYYDGYRRAYNTALAERARSNFQRGLTSLTSVSGQLFAIQGALIEAGIMEDPEKAAANRERRAKLRRRYATVEGSTAQRKIGELVAKTMGQGLVRDYIDGKDIDYTFTTV